jgi:hypothetical protein
MKGHPHFSFLGTIQVSGEPFPKFVEIGELHTRPSYLLVFFRNRIWLKQNTGTSFDRDARIFYPYTSSVDRLIPIVFIFVTVIGAVVATFVVTVTAAAVTSAAVATATAAFVPVTAAVTTTTVAAVTTTAVTTATTIAATAAVATATTVAAATAAVATATTVAAAAAVATATAIAAAATKATSAAATTFTWFSFLNYYRVSVKVSFIQCINSGLRLVVVRHFNEAKASGFAGVVVHDNFCGINFPKSFECFSQVFTRCPEIEFCNKNVHLKKIKE